MCAPRGVFSADGSAMHLQLVVRCKCGVEFKTSLQYKDIITAEKISDLLQSGLRIDGVGQTSALFEFLDKAIT